MTEIITDVNAQFDAEKMAQIAAADDKINALRARVAAGDMRERDNGDGTSTFTILTGWDRGETFKANQTSGEILASHGLDIQADGTEAYYGLEPAWWALGEPINPELTTGAAILKRAGLAWTVEKAPVQFTAPDGVTRELADKFVTYRSDTNEPLGAVGRVYFPFQNMTAYTILDELLGTHGLRVQSAGSFRGGRKIFVSAEIPEELIIDARGVADKVRQFVNVINTHDGSGSFIAVATPWFIRCGNTAKLAVKHATDTYKIRHTENGLNKIEEARVALRLARTYFEEFAAEENKLAQTAFTTNELDGLISEIWGSPEADASKREVTLDRKRREGIHAAWELELARLGATAFAAENAITGALDHFADLKPRGELKGRSRTAALGQALLEDSTGEYKNKAHAVLMRRVNG